MLTPVHQVRDPEVRRRRQPCERRLRSRVGGLTFACRRLLSGGMALLGGLMTMASAG
nr:hypothetical protein [Klebsiella pneumoniae]